MNLIDDLGGPVAIGAALGVTPQAVTNWRRRGWPDSAKWRLLALAQRRGMNLTIEALEERLPRPAAGLANDGVALNVAAGDYAQN